MEAIEDVKVGETKLGDKLDAKHGAKDGTKLGIKPDVKPGLEPDAKPITIPRAKIDVRLGEKIDANFTSPYLINGHK